MTRWPSGLRLAARRGDSEPTFDGGRTRLDGRHAWLLFGAEPQLIEIQRALPGMAELVGSVLVIDFGNAVGRFEIPHLGPVEVVSSKWTDRDFDSMLADLSRVAAQLPFAARSGGSLPYDRTLIEPKAILYQLFAYLRHVLADDQAGSDALAPALAAILREPHRRVAPHSRLVSADRARTVSPSELMALVEGRRPMVRCAPEDAGRAAALLGGCLPTQLDETVIRDTVDTPENRFVKMFLDTVVGIVDRVDDTFHGADVFSTRIRAECALLRKRLEPIQRARLWREVGCLVHLPASSTVLQRRRGYRTVFGCHARMRLGSRLPLDDITSKRLLEIRDIAELYELWCFFACVETGISVLGPPAEADRLHAGTRSLDVHWDYRVRWHDGTAVYYNGRFSRSRANARRSYSLPLRPDIVVEIPCGPAAGLHLFDAKFRVESLGNTFDTLEADGEDGARRSIFKRDDIYKMHTYRDAIPSVRSAWVLYPGSEDRFFSEVSSPWDGVGAAAMTPSCCRGCLPLASLFAANRC